MKITSPTRKNKVLRGTIRETLASYWRVWRTMLIATLPPILLIALLRLLTDDSTGDQYNTLIALISIFTTALVVRISVAGWNRKQIRTIPYYSGVMMRLLSVIGLVAIYVIASLPALAGFVLVGLILVKELAVGWMVLAGPIFGLGLVLMLMLSLALYALMDDMSLTVAQAFRVSLRLTRRYFWPVVRFWLLMLAIATVLVGVFIVLSRYTPLAMQDLRLQILLDGLVSWIITPFILFIGAVVYKRLVEDYE